MFKKQHKVVFSAISFLPFMLMSYIYVPTKVKKDAAATTNTTIRHAMTNN